MKQINLKVFKQSGNDLHETKGYKVENIYGLDLAAYKGDYSTWVATEAKTGLAFAYGDTRTELLADIERVIKKHTIEKFKEVIDNQLEHLNRCGFSVPINNFKS